MCFTDFLGQEVRIFLIVVRTPHEWLWILDVPLYTVIYSDILQTTIMIIPKARTRNRRVPRTEVSLIVLIKAGRSKDSITVAVAEEGLGTESAVTEKDHPVVIMIEVSRF